MGLLAALVSAGSGYQFATGAGSMGDVHFVAIETPANDSFDPGIEFTVARALRREAMRRGARRVVEDSDAADLVLSGRVLPIVTTGTSVSSVVLTLEYEIRMQVLLEARYRDGRELPIDRLGLAETERYLASADLEVTRKNRAEALRLVASAIATRVYDSLAAGLAP